VFRKSAGLRHLLIVRSKAACIRRRDSSFSIFNSRFPAFLFPVFSCLKPFDHLATEKWADARHFLRPRRLAFNSSAFTLPGMLDKSFLNWWLGRVAPFADVSPEKLAAERDSLERQQEFNNHYGEFLNSAVLPAIDNVVKMLAKARVVHRVSTWGNQIALRVHLSWRWGELVIAQRHEDCVTFEHHIITEGERRGDDSAEDHEHQYDLRDPIPGSVALQELQFFLSRIVQDLVDLPPDTELPPGEEPG